VGKQRERVSDEREREREKLRVSVSLSVCPGEPFITRHHTASSLPLPHIPTTHTHAPLYSHHPPHAIIPAEAHEAHQRMRVRAGRVVRTRDTTPCLSSPFEPPLKKNLNKKNTRSWKRSADTATFAGHLCNYLAALLCILTLSWHSLFSCIVTLPFYALYQRCLCMHCNATMAHALSLSPMPRTPTLAAGPFPVFVTLAFKQSPFNSSL
jgi:hypothetical protein